jgi:oligosaccharide repeat unit polymerase
LNRCYKFKEGKIGYFLIIFGSIFWYVYPGLINALNDPFGFNKVGKCFNLEDHLGLIVLLILFVISFKISYLNFKQYSKKVRENNFPVYDMRRAISLCFVFILIGMIPLLHSGLGFLGIVNAIFGGRTVEKIWLYNKNIGNMESFFYVLARSFLISSLSLLFVIVLNFKNKVKLKIILWVTFLLTSAIVLFDSGTRSITALIFFPSIIIYLSQIKETKKYVIYILIVICFLLITIQMQFLLRNEWNKEIVSDRSFNYATLGGSCDFYSESLLAIKLVPQKHDYFMELDPWIFLTLPIPRSIWSSKPVSEIAAFYTMERWGVDIYKESGNVFPGMIGQYYMSWGFLGPIIIGFIFGLVCSYVDQGAKITLLNCRFLSASIYISVGVFNFLCFRFVSPGFFVPILIYYMITKLSEKKYVNICYK